MLIESENKPKVEHRVVVKNKWVSTEWTTLDPLKFFQGISIIPNATIKEDKVAEAKINTAFKSPKLPVQ